MNIQASIRLSLGLFLAAGLPGDGLGSESPKANEAKPWTAYGTVTDVVGKPVPGATVSASAGMGTLMPTGKAVTGSDGSYHLNFGPGFISESRDLVQAATISVSLPGHFETNLHRQGDLVAAYKAPQRPVFWGNKTTNDLVLPWIPRRLDFVLAPAASIRGVLLDASGKPLANRRVGITGEVLPPSSSVLAEIQTDAQGRFAFENVPTGYEFRLYAENGRAQERNRPSFTFKLHRPVPHDYRLQVRGDQLVEAGK